MHKKKPKMTEFSHYLGKFKQAPCFAVIKIGGNCLNGNLVEPLRVLHSLSLYPVVVHGGGPQIDSALKNSNIEAKKVNGIRYTGQEALQVVVKTLTELNDKFVEKLNSREEISKGFNGIFEVDGPNEMGYVGDVSGMKTEKIMECLSIQRIPVVSSLGTNGTEFFNPNADSCFEKAVLCLNPLKAVVLTSSGGVLKDGKIIPEMDVKELRNFIFKAKNLEGMHIKLKAAFHLAEKGYDIQITSPENLLLELFSHKGAGTYIQGNK